MSLGSNTFLKSASHAQAAAKIYGVRSYAQMLRSDTDLVNGFRAKVGDTDLVVQAQASVDQFAAAVRDGQALVAAAAAALQADGLPFFRDPPPADFNVDDWNQAYTIDLDALAEIMPRLEQTSRDADSMIDVAMKSIKPAYTPPRTPDPIDWNAQTLNPEVAKLAQRVGDSVGKIGSGFGVTVGLVVVAGLAVLFLIKGKK